MPNDIKSMKLPCAIPVASICIHCVYAMMHFNVMVVCKCINLVLNLFLALKLYTLKLTVYYHYSD